MTLSISRIESGQPALPADPHRSGILFAQRPSHALPHLSETTSSFRCFGFWAKPKVFFGRADLRISKAAEEKLGHEILSDLPFLFDDYGGRLCPDKTLKHPRPFDYVVVLAALDSLSLRFIRGRGEFRVQLAAQQTPNAWEDLPTVLSIVDERFESRFFSSVKDVAAALEPRMRRLQDALSLDRYPELGKKLTNARNYDRAVIRQCETEINRRLFPDK